MCDRCDKEVIEMGILESDLPNLPYKLMNWFCMAKDCTHKTKVRDYGIAPLYFWPVKIFRGKGKWRGGWCDTAHGYICGKHFVNYKLDPDHFFNKYVIELNGFTKQDQLTEYLMKKIVPIIKSKLYKV